MARFRTSTGSITSASLTKTYKATVPTTGTQPADGNEVSYTLNNFKIRTRISEIHVVPSANTTFIFRIYENPNRDPSDLIYEVETTTAGDKVHDIIQGGMSYVDESNQGNLYIGIVNKSGGVAASFSIKIKHTPEI